VTRRRADRDLYTVVFLIAVVIFLVVEGLIVWSVIRYRRKPADDTLPAQTHGNNLAEVALDDRPVDHRRCLFVVSWQTLNAVDTAAANAQTRIRAVAGQFQWQFDYLDADGTDVLYTEVQATATAAGWSSRPGGRSSSALSAQDVIHAFYVPQFLFKRDVVPAGSTRSTSRSDAADAGQTVPRPCAELCGTVHRLMLFEVHAHDPADFDAWLPDRIAEASATPPRRPAVGPGGHALQLSAPDIAFDKSAPR
jgi:cytochrome c oxidase subunit 2